MASHRSTPNNVTIRHSELCSRSSGTAGSTSVNDPVQHVPPQTNVELVRAGFADFNAGDLDACIARMAPEDFVINLGELPEPVHGRDAWRQGGEMMKRAFPDIQAHIQDVVAAEDRVAVRLTFRGTHSGEFLGIPATGRSVEYVSHEFYRVADGLLAEEWICSDIATLIRQVS